MASAAQRIIAAKKTSEREKIANFSTELLKAPFFLRCAALFIDYMVLLAFPIGWLVLTRLFGETGTNVTISSTPWALGLIAFLVNFLVLPLFRGKTAGKLVLGLTILKFDGTALDLAAVLRRNFLGYLATVLTLGIGFLISAVNTSGRSLHDFIAGTVVIRGRKSQL